MISKGFSLLAFLGIVFVFVLIGGYSTGLSVPGFAKTFLRDFWGEPSWIVPPSWAAVYVCLAVSGWLVWIRTSFLDRIFPMFFYLAILTANATWWWLFFKIKSPDLALMNLGILWGLIVLTMAIFFSYSKWASVFLIPYFAWITYVLVFDFFLLKYR